LGLSLKGLDDAKSGRTSPISTLPTKPLTGVRIFKASLLLLYARVIPIPKSLPGGAYKAKMAPGLGSISPETLIWWRLRLRMEAPAKYFV